MAPKYEDYDDDPLAGSRAAMDGLAKRQPEDTPEAMLSDFDRRQADYIARRIAHYAGIESSGEHRRDHVWVRATRARCEWWTDAGRAAVRELIRWALIGVVGFVAFAIWLALKANLMGS